MGMACASDSALSVFIYSGDTSVCKLLARACFRLSCFLWLQRPTRTSRRCGAFTRATASSLGVRSCRISLLISVFNKSALLCLQCSAPAHQTRCQESRHRVSPCCQSSVVVYRFSLSLLRLKYRALALELQPCCRC